MDLENLENNKENNRPNEHKTQAAHPTQCKIKVKTLKNF